MQHCRIAEVTANVPVYFGRTGVEAESGCDCAADGGCSGLSEGFADSTWPFSCTFLGAGIGIGVLGTVRVDDGCWW
jgi:hypothetical protein